MTQVHFQMLHISQLPAELTQSILIILLGEQDPEYVCVCVCVFGLFWSPGPKAQGPGPLGFRFPAARIWLICLLCAHASSYRNMVTKYEAEIFSAILLYPHEQISWLSQMLPRCYC